MNYNFTKEGNLIIVTLNTESGNYDKNIQTYTSPSMHLSGNLIYLFDFNREKNKFSFVNFGTIGDQTPTNIDDAFLKLKTLIAS